MTPFCPVVSRIHALQEPINQLRYNRRECQQLVDHIKAFISSFKEKNYMQDLVELLQKLFVSNSFFHFSYINYLSRALGDLYDVLTDIHQQPQLKEILWRDGISSLVSQVYEILNASSFNVGNTLCCEYQKYNRSLVTFEALAEDLILRTILNEKARRLDMDYFHDMIRTAQDDEILKVLKSSAVSGRGNIINIHSSDTGGA